MRKYAYDSLGIRIGYWVPIPTRRKVRWVFIVTNKYHKLLQRTVATQLALRAYVMRECKCGQMRYNTAYIPGGSIAKHVMLHARTAAQYDDAVVIKMDIRNCFNSLRRYDGHAESLWAHAGQYHDHCVPAPHMVSKKMYLSEISLHEESISAHTTIQYPDRKTYNFFHLRRTDNFDGLFVSHHKVRGLKVAAQGLRTSPHVANCIIAHLERQWQEFVFARYARTVGHVTKNFKKVIHALPGVRHHLHTIRTVNTCDTGDEHDMPIYAFSRYADDILITVPERYVKIAIDTYKTHVLDILKMRPKYIQVYKRGDSIQVCGTSWAVGSTDVRVRRNVRRRMRALAHIAQKYNDEYAQNLLKSFTNYALLDDQRAHSTNTKAGKILSALRIAGYVE
jgi:hypothetical protein